MGLPLTYGSPGVKLGRLVNLGTMKITSLLFPFVVCGCVRGVFFSMCGCVD